MIEKESWKIIELVIRRYPDKKREYEQYISEIMASSPATGVNVAESDDYSKPQSVTEAKALKMSSDYADKLKKEIEAVELVYNNLKPEEQKLMRIRYWTDRRRNIPYLKIKGVNYSERQMRRITYKIIQKIGKYIGEIQ